MTRRLFATLAPFALFAALALRTFHDVVLGGGTVPLDVLEANVRRRLSQVSP